jgi:hypothetical protein
MTKHGFRFRRLSTHCGLKVAVLAVALSLGGFATAFGARPQCTDLPISLTFLPTTVAPAAISNDNPMTAYQNGVSGVSAVIHYNMACDGTRDATLNLNNSKRTLVMQFPNAVPGSTTIQAGPASFAGGAAFATQAFFNVHNILGYGLLTPGVAAVFYTKVTSTFPAPDRKTYRLALYPDNFTCPGVCSPVPDGTSTTLNQPVETEWAKVTYTPRDTTQPWSLTNADSWVVDGELTSATDTVVERATLLLEGRSNSFIHYGQYSMPFKILVTALAPLE